MDIDKWNGSIKKLLQHRVRAFFFVAAFLSFKKKLLSSQKSIERVRQKSNKIQGLSHRARKIEMERSHLEAHRENVKTQNILIY